jgi:hypothetical protein
VDDEAGGKAVGGGEFGVASAAGGEAHGFEDELGAGRAVDCSVDAASAAKGRVGGVDDGVNRKLGDVALVDAETHLDIMGRLGGSIYWASDLGIQRGGD